MNAATVNEPTQRDRATGPAPRPIDQTDKFVERFHLLCDQGKGFDYAYAGWYVRLLGIAEAGWLPVVMSDYAPVVFDRIPLNNFLPDTRKLGEGAQPILPLPPPGELKQDYIV
jgi:hypothetical protein